MMILLAFYTFSKIGVGSIRFSELALVGMLIEMGSSFIMIELDLVVRGFSSFTIALGPFYFVVAFIGLCFLSKESGSSNTKGIAFYSVAFPDLLFMAWCSDGSSKLTIISSN
jgi:hypothetical protein